MIEVGYLCYLKSERLKLKAFFLTFFPLPRGSYCKQLLLFFLLGFPGGSDVKESACNAGNLGSIPGLG